MLASHLTEITIPLRSHDEAILVLGPYDRFAKLLRQALDIEVYARGGNLCLKGGSVDVDQAKSRIEHLLGKSRKGRQLDLREIEAILAGAGGNQRPAGALNGGAQRGGAQRGGAQRGGAQRGGSEAPSASRDRNGASGGRPFQTRSRSVVTFRERAVEPRNESQRRYCELMDDLPLVFGLGSAGTGKTYLAVAQAVRAMRRGEVRRLVITRPVVEAGEHLGFLPGDLQQKLNPYMRPIYDALFDLLDPETLMQLEEANLIEVAPLAYMRGRTLSNSFVILDEGQNTTVGQMKMFLTRLGEGSQMVVTGDPSQNDIPRNVRSGLPDAVQRLRGQEGIGVCEFSPDDIVRHPLVSRIVRAYQPPVPDSDHADH